MSERLHFPLPAEGVHRTLRDGTIVLLRPIRASDKASLEESFERLSPESRYRRFFTAMPKLPAGWSENLTDVDHKSHRAWVVVDPNAPTNVDGADGLGVAVGRLVADPEDPAVAEAAFTVLDDYQQKGIGHLLLDAIVSSAALNGIERIRAETMHDNHGMIDLMKDLGATKNPARTDHDLVCYEFEVPSIDDADITTGALYEIMRFVAAQGPAAQGPLKT